MATAGSATKTTGVTAVARVLIALGLAVVAALGGSLPMQAQAAPSDLDATFGAGGKVLTPVGATWDAGHAIALQPDGRIVVAGSAISATADRIGVARYRADGALDTSFAGDGTALPSFGGSNDAGWGVALQVDGKIVLGGIAVDPLTSAERLAVYRLTPSGYLDGSFGGTGTVRTAVDGSTSAVVTGVAVQTDGRIVAAGRVGFPAPAGSQLVVARYLATGALDATFGGTGLVTTPVGLSAGAAGVALQPDGKIVVAGWAALVSGSGQLTVDLLVARYSTEGRLDPSFGNGGIATVDVSESDFGAGVALQRDGRIVVTGYTNESNGPHRFAVARLEPSGALDTSFGASLGTNGFASFSVAGVDAVAQAVAVQPNGRIVLAGWAGSSPSSRDFALVRLEPDGTPDTSFGNEGAVLTPVGPGIDQAHAIALQPDGGILVAGLAFNGSNDDFAVVRYVGDPPAVCGDGAREDPEQCDDGNLAAGDCCSANCAFEPAGSACADDGAICTADTCDGAGECEHPPQHAGVECRASAGPCDVAEACDGTGAACPADLLAAAGAICRPVAGPCDAAESCDGLGSACPEDAALPDADRDALCDAIDPCTNLGHGRDFVALPRARLVLERIASDPVPGDDALSLSGAFDLADGFAFSDLDPLAEGARLLLLDAEGAALLDERLAPGAWAGRGTRGWRSPGGGRTWTFRDATGSTQGGIEKLVLRDRSRSQGRGPSRVHVRLEGRDGTYPVAPGDAALTAILVLGGQAQSAAGACGEVRFVAGECRFDARRVRLTCTR